MSLEQRVLTAPDDGSLGPLLRIADDRLAPRAGYGRHHHRAVDVVALLVDGGLRHARFPGEDGGATLRPGDVGVLRAGDGLEHDEVAGPAGARVLQSYLRAHEPEAPPSHEVRAGADGWVDLRRLDARLWLARSPAPDLAVPAGLRVVVTTAGSGAATRPAGPLRVAGAAAVLVWQLDTARPAWATD